MSRAPLLLAALLAASVLAVPAAHAFDNGSTPNGGQNPAVNPQQFESVLSKMAANSNDPQFSNLVSQFDAAVSSGNSAAIQSALQNLQSYASTMKNGQVVSSFLDSASVGPGGLTVNPSTLAGLLGLNSLNSQGVPSNLVGMDPTTMVNDLGLVAGLMGSVNPSFGASLAGVLSGLTGPGGVSPGGLSGVQLPSFSSPFSGGPPSLGQSSGTQSDLRPGPSFDLQTALVPAALVAAAVALFLLRGRLALLLRGQALPGGVPVADVPDADYDPSSPRKRILYAFSRVVRAMGVKGVIRERADTSREFSRKCGKTPQSPHVSTVSTLYEKAKFSVADVSDADAQTAETEAAMTEQVGARA